MKFFKKIFIVLVILIVCGFIYLCVVVGTTEVSAVTTEYTGFTDKALESGTYGEYSDLHKNDETPNDEIVIDCTTGFDYAQTDNEVPKVLNVGSLDSLYVPDTGDLTYHVNVPVSGMYNIKVKYFAMEGRSSSITRGLKINGDYPFKEVSTFTLTRIWQDEYDINEHHVEDKHDIKPSQLEKLRWNEMPIRDTEGYYNGEAYSFYFSKGWNTITLLEDKEPFYLSTITLYHEKEILSYADISKQYQENNLEKKDNAYLSEVQGESSYEKSTTILSPVANWSSYKVDPYVNYKTRYNTIGGTTWRVAGDWVSWNVKVPTDGLYCLTFKVLQNYSRGMYSTRRLYINGEVPFKECQNILFKYDSEWQNVTLGDENGNYYFYLKANTDNIITLEATIGIYHDIVMNAKEIISKLNTLYRQVVMTAGVSPEKYQNYLLAERIDNLWETIDEIAAKLEESINMIIDIAGSRSSLVSSFERTLYQMNKFKGSETNILTGLNELDDNISSLGTMVMTISEQSLAIDKIYIHDENTELPKASTNFFQKVWHELVMLVGSYGANTSLESSVECDGPTITVWIMTGRDQSQLLRQLIDDSFTMQHNINVELKLVTSSVLLPATLTNNGPDVAIGVGQSIPVNWGIRNAVVDMSKLSGYDEFKNSFNSSALTPFTFNGKTYALPDTQDFLISFVRTDIASEIGVTIPETWNEVEDVLPVLQRRYLEYYIPNSKGALSPVLYSMIHQNGGSLYNENGSATLLTEKKSEEAFVRFTKFFSDKGFAISANFSNRFRTGETPIGIASYSLYNTLSVFAPDIKGQWEFAKFPGYMNPDGTISNESTSTSTGTIILTQTKELDASWEFVKWWLGEKAQLEYARGMEAILGAAARYPTANLKAFDQLPWSNKEKKLLDYQREQSVGIPTVPGDYIVGRYIDNSFRAVLNKGVNPRDSLYDYSKKINTELSRKREEFGLE